MTRQVPKRAQGFTLIELVLVLLIAAIISTYAIIRFPSGSINISAQADQIVADIRHTQSLAINRGQRYRINFASDRYWISSADGATLYTHPASSSTTIFLDTGISLSSSHGFLVFDGQGTPYINTLTPGTALGSDAVVTLTAASETRTVRITPETGRVIKP